MYILLDIGGTNMRIAVSDDGETFGAPLIYETPQDFGMAKRLLESVLGKIIKDKKVKSLCAGLPGAFDWQKKILVRSPHLPGWEEENIHQLFSDIVHAPVFLENDATLACRGEAVFGAGKNASIVAYFTISTGVGGARAVNGKIDENAFGFEPGHQIIDQEKMLSLEDCVSGTAFEKKYNKKPSNITDLKIWDNAAKTLAVGLHNSVLHWSPEVVVLGGSMILKSPGIEIESVQKYLAEIMKIFPTIPEIKKAECGEFAGLAGALALLVEKNKK